MMRDNDVGEVMGVSGIGQDERSFLWARWIFLRCLGLIFLSAFYSLAFQIHGLIGELGILPAADYLRDVHSSLGGVKQLWYAPSVFWLSASDTALTIVVAAGVVCSFLLVFDVWPKLSVSLCTLLFMSCIAVLQDFSSYQSDGMLLEAGFISIFFAPRGIRPKIWSDPPSRASLFLLRWEWFRIYFESGIVKLASGDRHWRDFTAMDEYYQNGPLPTWLGYYAQHLPHWYHAATVAFTLGVELVLVWAVFLPRRFRLTCAAIVTVLQIGIITTANYAFLNYLVLVLGILLVDDHVFARWPRLRLAAEPFKGSDPLNALNGGVMAIVFYTTIVAFFYRGGSSIVTSPARFLAPFRIANAYGLFAVMTEERYEIELQGSRDGVTWTPYPFRYKPQNPNERPGIYAPYQPRFEWNLWFASLGPWQQSPWVVQAQQRLVEGSPSVLKLFRNDPFNGKPPALVRTVRYQYWFTDLSTRRKTGAWWRRVELGPFTGVVGRQ
jgi:hypothetical protein